MLHTGECGQLFLELRDLWAHDPLPALDGGKNGAVQRFAKAPALSLKIDKGNGGGQRKLQFSNHFGLLGGLSLTARHTLYCDLRHGVETKFEPKARFQRAILSKSSDNGNFK
jgi:hypothetical protein